MKRDVGNRVWLARMPKEGEDNASVVISADNKTLFLAWRAKGVPGGGHIDRRLARLLAKRINEALDF